MEQLVDNRYRIVRPLGSGGMADVYLAHDDVLERDVALKIMSGRYSTDDEFVERFRREAQSAAALSHSNIISIYDRGASEDGTYYIAMEYLPGGTLKDRIVKRGALMPRTAAAVALQIAEALRAAHHAGVVHRDIKPHNVLITDAGDVKVGDFGIARAATSDTMTKTGLILGTAHYISPEQAMGDPVGPQSDLYSLGVVLYEMLTGTLPYDAETSLGIAMKHVNGHLTPPREINPEVTEGINAVTVRLLAKNPGDRYADADELIEDLERVLDGLEPAALEATRVMNRAVPAGAAQQTPVAPPPPAEAKEDKRRRRWPLFLLPLLLLLALLGGGAYALGLLPDLTPPAQVPDLTDAASVREAQGIAGEDFEVREVDREDSEEPLGAILSQDPEPGGEAERGSEISVVTSARQVAQVPAVRDETREGAERILRGAGFKVDERTDESSAEYEGYVMEQNPRGGATAVVDSTVTITVGEGPGTVEVPDVANIMPVQARGILEEAGLRLGSQSTTPSDSVPEGSIVSQSPKAGSEAEPGSSVAVTVSSGPSQVTVPDVTGQDWITAAQNLQAAGLSVNRNVTMVASDRPENEILSTNPEAGTQVPPGTTVTLTTSQGPQPQQSTSSGASNSQQQSTSSGASNSPQTSAQQKSKSKST
ncbi:MAG: Stk1 family PASTA domain-containing Ser/Thr kinase [Actinomycetota bacterium]|nr:Stk1 family PASTA domain-containing Ser/Thr kinase [Actinomycetota bacterium]